MEAKLREYRALKRRKELIDNTKAKIADAKEKVLRFITPKIFADMTKEEEVVLLEDIDEKPSTPLLLEEIPDVTSETSEVESLTEPESRRTRLIRWGIGLTLWIMFYIIFLKLEFGAVYFVITVLIGIYFNTGTRPKRKGEVSAYSVFNKNCVSIDGTLKAEQFEREIRYGAGSVR